MANLLSRLLGRDEVSRAMTLDAYLRMVSQSGLAGYMPPVTYYGPQGKPTEREPNDFEGYVTSAFMANPIIFGLMQRRASVFSEARFAWRAVKGGGSNPGDLLPTAAGLELLQRPWPNGTTGELLQRAIQDVDLGGNFYCVVEGDRLRRLRPDWVQIVLSGDPQTEHDVDVLGYVYAPGGPDNGNWKSYLPDEVVHWSPIPDPLALYRGMSWITPVLKELAADQAATTHKTSHLRQGGVLGPIIKAPPGLSVEQFRRFIEAADSSHAGPTNSGKFLFLASGSEVSTVASTLQQLDLRALSGAGETRMAVASGVPAVIAQISEGLQGSSLNTGNYGAAKRMWIDGGLRPLWRSACAAFGNVIQPPDLSGLDVPEGTTAELSINEADIALLHEDRQDQANILSSQFTAINTGITAGFKPKAVVIAVRDNDLGAIENEHSGLTSVQLVPPGQSVPGQPGTEPTDGAVPDAGGEDWTARLRDLRANGGTEDATRSQILRAQVDHTGAMVALVPSEVDAQHLAIDGGELVDDLHLTLFYLGDAKDISPADRKAVVGAVKAVVARRSVAAMPGQVFGAALWNPQGDEPAWVLNVGDPQERSAGQDSLAVLRRAVGDALAYGVPGLRMPRQHSPWSAHVCLAYGADSTDAEEMAQRVGPVTFDRIRVAFGGTVTDIPLGEVKRASGSWSRHPHPGQRFRHGWVPLPTELLDDALEPEVGDQTDDAPEPRSDLEAEADRLLAEPPRDENAIQQWVVDSVPGVVAQFLADDRLAGLRDLDLARLNRTILGRVLVDADLNDEDLTTPGTLWQAVWRALWQYQIDAGLNRSRLPFVGRARLPRDGDGDGFVDDGKPTMRPAPPRAPKRPMLDESKPARKLTGRERLAEDYAAGRISKAELRRYLRANPDAAKVLDEYRKGRISREDAARALPDLTDEQAASVPYGEAFLRSLLHADEAAQFANAGDRQGLEDYLRRQNTAPLMFMGQGHYGLTWDRRRRYSHDEVVALVAEAVWRAEGPAALGTAAKSRAATTGRGDVKVPSRSALMRRSKPDLQRDALRAGVSPDGTKAEIVERLLAALRAALPEQDRLDAESRPGPAAPLGTVRVAPVASLDDVRPDYLPGEWQAIGRGQLVELDARQLAARLRAERDARVARLGSSRGEQTDAQIDEYALRTATEESATWADAYVTYVNGPYRVQSFVKSVDEADLRKIATLADLLAEHGPLDRARIGVTAVAAGDLGAIGAHIPGSGGDILLTPRAFAGVLADEAEKMPSAAKVSLLQYVLAHEWGHALSDAFDPSALFALVGIAGMSPYGQRNEREAFAEAWAEWFLTSGQTANPAAQAYADHFGWR